MPLPRLTRRRFLGTLAIAGTTRKSGVRLAGGFVHESHTIGHRLRDGVLSPVPQAIERRPLVIVGGGIAGLSAAWRLHKRGFTDFVLLEMEPEAGGNARWGQNEVTAFPWAAHYVPVPGPRAALVRELFEDLGLLRDGRFAERHLCHAPVERLFVHGKWQEGLEPHVGPTARDRDQWRRFLDRTRDMAESGAFTVPMGEPPPDAALDGLSMRDWLDAEGFDSPLVRWHVDYACRDDYGALARDTSAWAGIHYFSSRDGEEDGPLTWPEGNGWIAARLLERVGSVVRTGAFVERIVREGRRWRIITEQMVWEADAVIVAAPAFVADRILPPGRTAPRVEYSPWLTANLTLERWPANRGAPPAWDNVLFDSPSLGYVIATHQSLRTYVPATVWTYYWPLAEGSPAANRAWLLAQRWDALANRILDDLSRAHPDIRECVSRVDVFRMGHAMPRPGPGFLAARAARAAARVHERVFFAHSDVSGLPLFEEAQYRGVAAAESALEALAGG
jgi:phytoene dehydrogenase-like protein